MSLYLNLEWLNCTNGGNRSKLYTVQPLSQLSVRPEFLHCDVYTKRLNKVA